MILLLALLHRWLCKSNLELNPSATVCKRAKVISKQCPIEGLYAVV